MRVALALVGVVIVVVAWRLASTERRARTEPAGPSPEAPSGSEESSPALAAPPERAPLRPGEADAPARAATTISGRVLAPDGTPGFPAHALFVWDERGKVRSRMVWTRADGSFEIALDDPGVRGDLLAFVYEHRFAPAARTGVEAGTHGLELRLGPRASFRLDVRDAGGRALASRADFAWQLAGHAVADEGRGTALAPLEFPRSPVPFVVQVEASGYERATMGPLDPATVGERLVVTLTSFPRVRGRVTRNGEPVAGVLPELWRVGDVRGWHASSPTDVDGRFEIPYQTSGTCELRLFDRVRGGGRVGPIQLDGRDADGFELEITELPGAIEGRVILPEGHAPAEVWILASSAESLRSLRSDGTYSLAGLPPGPCSVQVTEGWADIAPGPDRWVQFEEGRPPPPSWLASPAVYTVEVRAGETTTLDIDLARERACRLVGRIVLDGRAPPLSRGSSEGVPIPFVWLTSDAGERAFTSVGADGEFALGVETPGACRLEITLPLEGEGARWKLTDRVTLAPGPTPWTLELACGALRVVSDGGATSTELVLPPASWSASSGLSIELGKPARDDSGAFWFSRVPTGRVRFAAADGAAARECEVRAGERTEFVWSQ